LFYNNSSSPELISSCFAGVSPQMCQYRGGSEFFLLYPPARDVSQKKVGIAG